MRKKPNKQLDTTVEALQQKIKMRLLLLIAIVVTITVAMLDFGPKVGSLFGLISVNRGKQIQPPQASTPPPVFTGVPKAVNTTTIDIRGYATPKAKVELFVNGPKVSSVIADASGEFLFPNVRLNKATNTVFAKIGDVKSETVMIEYDEEPPEIEIEKPKEDEKIENLNERIEIIGKLNEKATVTINERTVVLKPDNSFYFLLGVKEGDVEIKIKATDIAGNTAEKELKVRYKKE